MIDIKDISNITRFSTPINEGSKRKYTLMKEDYITLKLSVDNPVYFKLGDYVDESFGLFELVDLCKPTINESTGGYDYELRLDAYYWKWKNKKFFYSPEVGGSEASWNLTATLDTHMRVLLRNLESLGYTHKDGSFSVRIDSTVEMSSKLISYDNTNLLDALTKIAETWKCEWWIIDSVIHFGRCEFGEPVDFDLEANVSSMSRSDSKTNFATRIYAFGSTRNISTNYRAVEENVVVNGITQKRLMLPVGITHIDAYPDMATEEAVEEIVVFDDVYPRRIGTVSDITTHRYKEIIKEEGKPDIINKWDAYRFKDKGIIFSEKYVIKQQELKIVFQSGSLNGMEFAVTFNPCDKEGGEAPIPEKNADGSWNTSAQVWEIVRNENYGRPIPDDVLRPKGEHMEGNVLIPADTYILSGFDVKLVSDTMIPTAEQELKEKALKYVEKSKIDPSTYDCKMMSTYAYNDGKVKLFDIGDRVNLINKAYFNNGRQSRIIGFEYPLDIPYDSPIYTVGETIAYSRIGEIESKVDSLTYNGQTYIGGSGAGSRIYVIGKNDKTSPSDSNVFSALRTLSEILSNNEVLKKLFLSKTGHDKTNYLLELLGGLLVDGGMNVKGGIISDTASIESIVNRVLFEKGLSAKGGITTDSLDSTEITTQLLKVIDKLVAGKASFSGDISSFDYAEKLLGWIVTASGRAEFQSLRVNGFFEADEFRYNRVSVITGEQWNAPGGGIIESVDTENHIIYLKLAPGELAAVELDDISKANFNNNTEFQTCFFRIIEKIGDSAFKYVLRSGFTTPPCALMHFVCYGNFTNKERQHSSYSTKSYKRYLTGVNNWEFTKDMIAMQLGDLSNLKLFGIDMTGHSAYLKNIYMTGTIKQLSNDGVTEVPVPAFKGVWVSGKHWYYDEVIHNGSTWLCIVDITKQEPSESATDWLETSAKGKDAVVVNMFSSNGNVFQNGSVSTVITVQVLKGDKDITASIPANRFSWEKQSKNADTDKIFNETHIGYGHTLEITPDDIYGRATFDCIVNL